MPFYVHIGGTAAAWSPAALFASSEVGAWYDPSDLSTMFQNSDGTVAVTTDGDPVGYIADKSGNGFHATQSSSAARPTYKTSGGLHWLDFDGTDDSLSTGTITPGTNKLQAFIGMRKERSATEVIIETSDNAGSSSGTYLVYNNGNPLRGFSKGTAADEIESTTISFPSSLVVTGIADISAPNNQLRIDGVVSATSAGSQGTGDYLAHPLYIGRRGGSSFSFDGRIFGLVLRFGANLASDVIDSAEAYMAAKSGVTL
jgi:hypothetical protein